jgi:hypothetical protein
MLGQIEESGPSLQGRSRPGPVLGVMVDHAVEPLARHLPLGSGQRIESWCHGPESDRRRDRVAVRGRGCRRAGDDLPENGVAHALGKAGIAIFGRCGQQCLDGADRGCLEEAGGALLADPEPAGGGDPVDPRLQNLPVGAGRG